MEYKSVSTHTLAGQSEAESLLRQGWTCYRVGLFMMYFRRHKAR